jgi:SAM-dependent methyltransferase
MRAWLLEYVVCPSCGDGLGLDFPIGEEEDIETGDLKCQGCHRRYPVRRGVPRLVTDDLEKDKQATVSAFGWEWLEFNQLHEDWNSYQGQFLDWVAPLDAAFFQEKVVLDAGCGMGRFSAAAARLGARKVIGIDLSNSVESAREFTRSLPNVAIVKADIYKLPFRNDFDFAFSIGVVHHLPDPAAGLMAISRHLKPDGNLFVWVYGYENNGWIRTLVNPVRKRLTSKLPHSALYRLSLAVTALAQPCLRLLYAAPEQSFRGRILPYYSYMHWLAHYGFRHNHHVIFDHLVAPTAFYVRKDELKAWFAQTGFTDVTISWRNKNSWRGFGRPTPAGVQA